MSRPDSTCYGALLPGNLASEATRGTFLILAGLVWPAVVHVFPAPVPLGPVLMPLLLPVALAAFLLPLRSALAVCAIMPFLSMAISGMPPVTIALDLVLEGCVLVACVKLLVRAHAPWWAAYAAGCASSRLAAWIVAIFLMGGSPSVAGVVVAQGLIGLGLVGLALPLAFRFLGRREQ